MKKNNEMISFTVKLGAIYYTGSVIIMALFALLQQDSLSRVNSISFLIGSIVILANYGLSAYDLNFFLKKGKKSIYMTRSLVRYFLLFIIVYVLHSRLELNIVVVAFEMMSFQLASIIINMFGLSGLLLKKE